MHILADRHFLLLHLNSKKEDTEYSPGTRSGALHKKLELNFTQNIIKQNFERQSTYCFLKVKKKKEKDKGSELIRTQNLKLHTSRPGNSLL